MKSEAEWITIVTLIATFLSTCESWLEKQPDDVDRGWYDHLYNNSPSLCLRECVPGQSRICYYKFHLEPYSVLGGACKLCPTVQADCYRPQCVTADGYERAILTVNRRLPGPSIQVCKGDKVVVDVKNQLPGVSTTIHWHGIRQSLTPWMDGVPMVTQCPILEGQAFRYHFVADEAGTYFWHSHDGLQKMDGVIGSMVVREPDSENIMRGYYDWDLASHTITVQDWMHTPANSRLPGLLREDRSQSPDSYLINGLGVLLHSLYDLYGPFKTPVAEFHVRRGQRYRFRIIGGTCLSCPFRITVQDHKLTVISMDGNPIEPVVVDNMVLSSGERYDVVIETMKPKAAYWIIVRGLGECRSAMQAAVLRYKGANSNPFLPHWTTFFGFETGQTLNPRNSKCTEDTKSSGLCVSQLRSQLPNPPQVSGPPDFQFILPFYFHYFKNHELFESESYNKYFVPLLGLQVTSLINNISNAMPPSPLLTQFWDVPPSKFCHEASCVGKAVCECINLMRVPLGAVVEFVLIDTSPPSPVGLTHPFHIHGHDFYVVEQGKLKLPLLELLGNLDIRAAGKVPRVLSNYLPSKDTVTVPAAGYAVVRVLADNPGFWLFHCHFAYHLATGMSAIIQVGELSDIPAPPPLFPRCREYLPPLEYV